MLEPCLVAATTREHDSPDGDHNRAVLRTVFQMLELANNFARTGYYVSCNQVAECWNLHR
jgi:hypothetical protein